MEILAFLLLLFVKEKNSLFYRDAWWKFYCKRLKSKWGKKIVNFLFVNSFIRHAKAIIYLTKGEYEKCIFKHYRQESLITPNGIDMPEVVTKELSELIRFTYLARISIYDKGLDLLLEALKYLSEVVNNEIYFSFSFYGSSKDKEVISYLEDEIMSLFMVLLLVKRKKTHF